MKAWVIILSLFIVVMILLVIAIVTILLKEFKKGFCYTKTAKEEGCMLSSTDDCKSKGGVHFNKFEECEKYWDEQKKN